jgi:hypothetical protein
MTFEDYRKAIDIIRETVFNKDLTGREYQIKKLKKLTLLNLNTDEYNHVCEYIGQIRIEFNVLCNESEKKTKKSVRDVK